MKMRTFSKVFAVAVAALAGATISSINPATAVSSAPTSIVTIQPCVVLDTVAASGGLAGPLNGGQAVDVQFTGALPNVQGGASTCNIPSLATGVLVELAAVNPLRFGNLRAFPIGEPATGGVVNFSVQSPQLDNSNMVIIPLSALGKLTIEVNAGGSTLDTVDVRATAVGYLVNSGGQLYTAVTPCAVADSRPSEGSNGGFDGAYVGNETRTIDVAGFFTIFQGGGNNTCGVPSGADGVLVNLVGIAPTGQGAVGVRPAGSTEVTTYVSYSQTSPPMNNSNAVFVPLSADGKLDLFTIAGLSDEIHVRAVVLGYLEEEGDPFVPVSPCAGFDSRSAQGAASPYVGYLAGGQAITYQIEGTFSPAQGGGNTSCGIPANATSVLINLVAVSPQRIGNLKAYATGTTPTGGVVNFANVGMNNSNAIVVPLSGAGQIDVEVNAGPSGVGLNTVHVRGVVMGYFFDANPELEVELTGPISFAPPDYLPAANPVTITGTVSDNLAVDRVDLVIRSSGSNLGLAECGVGIHCFINAVQTTVSATLASPGAASTTFTFGPINLEAVGGSGSYTVTAFAYDAEGNIASDGWSFRTVAPSPPSISLEAPAQGAIVDDIVVIRGSASDENGIANVMVRLRDVNSGIYLQTVGNSLVWTASSPVSVPATYDPGSGTWQLPITAQATSGRTIIIEQVSAGDLAGNSFAITPNVTFTAGTHTSFPLLTVHAPSSNQVMPHPIAPFGTAFDPAGIAEVEVMLQDASLGLHWNGMFWDSTPAWIDANITAYGWSNVAWSITFPEDVEPPTATGVYELIVRATDVSGIQTMTAPIPFTSVTDVTPPSLNITIPSNGSPVSTPVMISGTANDTTGISSIDMTVEDTSTNQFWNGTGWSSTPTQLASGLTNQYGSSTAYSLTIFNPNAGTGSGNYLATVTARDLAGNNTTQTVSFFIDEDGPAISFVTPTQDQFISNAPVLIKGDATDPSGLGPLTLIVKETNLTGGRYWTGSGWSTNLASISVPFGNPGATSSAFSYSAALSGGSGSYQVEASADDTIGNNNTVGLVPFTVDMAPPAIAITQPAQGANEFPPFTALGTVSDDWEVDNVKVRLQDTGSGQYFTGSGFQATPFWIAASYIPGDPNWSKSLNPDGFGGTGAYSLVAVATDSVAKSTQTTARTFTTVDLVDPGVPVISTPADGGLVQDPPTIGGTATDNRVVAGVDITVREYICGSRYFTGSGWQAGVTSFPAAITSGTGTGSVAWSETPALAATGGCGEYFVRVTASDAAGNTKLSLTHYFDTDNQSPTVSISNPSNGAALVAPVFLSGTSSDDNPGQTVFVTVQDRNTNLWWDGVKFETPQEFLSTSGNWSRQLFPLGDNGGSGEYKITPYVEDAVGNTNTGSAITLHVLANDREVTITSGTTFGSRPFTFTGAAHTIDGLNDVELLIYELNSIGGSNSRYWTTSGWASSGPADWIPVTTLTTSSNYQGTWSHSFNPGSASTGVFEIQARLVEDDLDTHSNNPVEVQYDPGSSSQIDSPASGELVIENAGVVAFKGKAFSDLEVFAVEIRVQNTTSLLWMPTAGAWSSTPVEHNIFNLSQVGSTTYDWDRTFTLPAGKYAVEARSRTQAGGWSNWTAPVDFTLQYVP